MAIFRSFSEIVNSILERLRLSQPNLDTKPGTVSRDLFVDPQAEQLSRLHDSLLLVSEKQAPESAKGRDLERWANNFGITRRSGNPSNGVVVFTTSSISSDVPIPAGTIVTSRNNLQFRTIGTFVLSSAEKNRFAANANRLRNALNLAGITDTYAIEVPVEATSAGTSGNISSLQVIEHDLEDSLRVTNLVSFNGGTNQESDAAFRARVFAVFSGSNTGTAAGYRNAALSVTGVNDAIVIEPGDTLMLRDGTEIIQVNDGSFRILDSGTGGKVDLYILGIQLEEIVESYIFSDRSGTGDFADERNDFIMGQGNLDPTLTSEERRVTAFRTGNLPQQPASSLISVIGSSSGVLAAKVTDADGNVSGNYELIKDVNVDTGGSPFGFDKLRYISSEKEVDAETIIKQSLNSVDALRFSGVNELVSVFQDVNVVSENSSVSIADRSIVQLNHSPVVVATRVVNLTTGEVYVIESQNLDEDGLNNSGEITISGKTLPTTADTLSVDYTWRLIFDPFIDYNGKDTISAFKDESINDSIDWGVSNGVERETSIVERTDDNLGFEAEVDNNVSRVISVFSAVVTTGTIVSLTTDDGDLVPGIILDSSNPVIDNIVSITDDQGVELYNTPANDGSFSGRSILLPSDSPADSVTDVSLLYNKVEFFDIPNSDGSASNNIITLPSEDILRGAGVFEDVETLFLTEDDVYATYVAEINELIPSIGLTSLPINGSESSNIFLNSNLISVTDSNQPITFGFSTSGVRDEIERFGATRLSVDLSGIVRSGTIRVLGTALTRYNLNLTVGVALNGLTIDLGPFLRDALSVSTIPSNLSIARVDSLSVEGDSDTIIDLQGQYLASNTYADKLARTDASLSNTEFRLPSTSNNDALALSSGEVLNVSLLLADTNGSEDLFFGQDGVMVTDKVFGFVDRISASSGFRSTSGALIGSMVVSQTSQPGVGLSYSANYKFTAPKEGERITVRYNLNRLISDTTVNVENVRSITADVLVKESPTLPVDVRGEIIVNEEVLSSADTIIENVNNAVVNILNSSTLGGTVDYSDIINTATSVIGVDSVNVSLFNESGQTGRRSFVKALDNQSIAAGEVIFTAVSRKNFRIT